MLQLIRYILIQFSIEFIKRPWNTVARWLVVLTLSASTLFIFFIFDFTNRQIDQQLISGGATSIVVRELISIQEPSQHTPLIDSLVKSQILKGELNLFHVLRLKATHQNRNLLCFTSHQRFMSRQRSPYVLYTQRYAPGIFVPVTIDKQEFLASTRPRPSWWPKASQKDILMISAEAVSHHDPTLSMNIAIWEGPYDIEVIRQHLSAMRQSIKLDRLASIHLDHSLDLLEKIREMHLVRLIWQSIAITGSSLTMALIVGCLAYFEFKESRYTYDLLRSLGAPLNILVISQVLFNLAVVNLGLFSAWQVTGRFIEFIASESMIISAPIDTNQMWMTMNEMSLKLLITLDATVLISLLPISWAIRKEIGTRLT